MKALLSVGICPFCNGGHNTACFAEYIDGYYCFSCGKTKTCTREYMLKSDLDQSIIQLEAPKYSLNPKSFSPQILTWLYNYYIFEGEIKNYNLGYVDYDHFETNNKIIEGEGLIMFPNLNFFQIRFFPSKMFITKGDKKDVGVMRCRNRINNSIYICEDYISAIRLNQFVDVLCLFGTSLQKERLNAILPECPVIIYLDEDTAGKEATSKLRIQIQAYKEKLQLTYAYNTQITSKIDIISEKQPKELSPQQLRRLLS